MAVGSITSLIIIPSSSARFLNHINNHHGQFSSSSLLRVQGPLQKQLQGFRVIPLPYHHNHYHHNHQPHGISSIDGIKFTDTDNTPSVFASAASSGSAVSSIGIETGSGLSLEVREIKERCKKWQWRGHTINYLVHCTDEDRPPLLLVHGFGASVAHWRRNILTLSQSYTVYAIDLLGFGASDKPLGFPYTMEAWAQLILDFLDEIIQKPTVLIGNSIGSLACVIAASESSHSLVRALVLLNCAGGMNNKAIVDDWRIKLLLPLLWLIDFLLNQKGIASFIFERVTRRENLKNILLSVYGNKDFVDDDLVEIIREPAQGEEALDAFVSIVTGPPGPSPVQLMPRINLPVLVLWGDQDTLTPLDGPVGKYFSSLPAQLPNISLFILEGVGHCPHDDRPDLVHEKLLPWLDLLPQRICHIFQIPACRELLCSSVKQSPQDPFKTPQQVPHNGHRWNFFQYVMQIKKVGSSVTKKAFIYDRLAKFCSYDIVLCL